MACGVQVRRTTSHRRRRHRRPRHRRRGATSRGVPGGPSVPRQVIRRAGAGRAATVHYLRDDTSRAMALGPPDTAMTGEQAVRAFPGWADADRLVLPLVHVVHVDDVDRGDDRGGRTNAKARKPSAPATTGMRIPIPQRPAVGLRRPAGHQRHQRGHQVERRHGLAGLQRIALTALAARARAGTQLGAGGGVEPDSRGEPRARRRRRVSRGWWSRFLLRTGQSVLTSVLSMVL